MLLKPQLGLGAMSRLPSAKSRILIASQRSSASAIHPPGPIATAASLYNPDPAGIRSDSLALARHALLFKSDLRDYCLSQIKWSKCVKYEHLSPLRRSLFLFFHLIVDRRVSRLICLQLSSSMSPLKWWPLQPRPHFLYFLPSLVHPVDQGSGTFIHKGPGSEYLRLSGPCGLCCDYSAWEQPQMTRGWTDVAPVLI